MKAVVFDMDGVIFDSETLVIQMWKVVAEKYGIEDIEATCRECLGTNAAVSKEKFSKRYGQEFPYDKYKKEMSDLFHANAAGGKLKQKPGIRELLEYLQKNHIKAAVASSTRREVVMRELEEGGLLPYFDKVICGDMVQRSKPEPDIYLERPADKFRSSRKSVMRLRTLIMVSELQNGQDCIRSWYRICRLLLWRWKNCQIVYYHLCMRYSSILKKQKKLIKK